MSGRPEAANPEQRARVLLLALEGESQREIAQRVFGDAGLHGRVERILAAERKQALAPGNGEAPGQGSPPSAEELFVRCLRQLEQRLDAGERVPMSEIAAALRVQAMLEGQRTLARLRELTGAAPSDSA